MLLERPKGKKWDRGDFSAKRENDIVFVFRLILVYPQVWLSQKEGRVFAFSHSCTLHEIRVVFFLLAVCVIVQHVSRFSQTPAD